MPTFHMIRVVKEDLFMLFDERSCCYDDMMRQDDLTPYVGMEQPWGDFTPGATMADDRFGCPPMCPPQPVCPPGPIVEPAIEKCMRRDICHEVKHICPIHTRVINNHIFRHTYAPQYTCSEQNLCSHVHLGSCCDFV
jgi:hypothetical protein